jgi:hypothetical protein
MKVDAKQLFEVVRSVVVDEMKKQLPGLIKTHLSEMYVKKALSEISRGADASESFAGSRSSEHARTALIESVEERAPDIIQPREVVNKLLSKNNPLSFVYEGVKIPDEGPAADAGIPIEKIAPPDSFAAAGKLFEAMENSAKAKAPTVSAAEKLAELERRRKLLDVPA